MEVMKSRVSPRPTWNLLFTHVIRFTAESCRIPTPLGLPVDPEVYMIYASSCGQSDIAGFSPE